MSQTDYDNMVLSIGDYHVTMANKCCLLRRQNDPDWMRMEEELMLLQNVLFAMRDYDITSDILTDAEIAYYQELAIQVIQSCPL
jgi:hypothetical protein